MGERKREGRTVTARSGAPRVEKTRVRGGTRPSVGERGGGEEAGPVEPKKLIEANPLLRDKLQFPSPKNSRWVWIVEMNCYKDIDMKQIASD